MSRRVRISYNIQGLILINGRVTRILLGGIFFINNVENNMLNVILGLHTGGGCGSSQTLARVCSQSPVILLPVHSVESSRIRKCIEKGYVI